jgi:hypothetical protein
MFSRLVNDKIPKFHILQFKFVKSWIHPILIATYSYVIFVFTFMHSIVGDIDHKYVDYSCDNSCLNTNCNMCCKIRRLKLHLIFLYKLSGLVIMYSLTFLEWFTLNKIIVSLFIYHIIIFFSYNSFLKQKYGHISSGWRQDYFIVMRNFIKVFTYFHGVVQILWSWIAHSFAMSCPYAWLHTWRPVVGMPNHAFGLMYIFRLLYAIRCFRVMACLRFHFCWHLYKRLNFSLLLLVFLEFFCQREFPP